MLADPQSVTIGTTPGAVSLPRTGTGDASADYQSADGNTHLVLSHAYNSRYRHVVRLDFQKTAPDPLVTGNNRIYSMSVSLVVNTPNSGFTAAEQGDVVKALATWLSASSYAVVPKILGGES